MSSTQDQTVAEDRDRRTEEREQRTEEREQRTEEREQRTDEQRVTVAETYRTLTDMRGEFRKLFESHGEQLARIKNDTGKTNGHVAAAIERIAGTERRLESHARSFHNLHRRIDDLSPKQVEIGTPKDAKARENDPATLSITVSKTMMAAIASVGTLLAGAASIVFPILIAWAKKYFGVE